jgi:hypothetical protein
MTWKNGGAAILPATRRRIRSHDDENVVDVVRWL